MTGGIAAVRARVVLAGVIAALLLQAGLSAQNRRWADPYERGEKAFKAGNFQEAIKQLEQAVGVDPRQGANKRVEGVFSINYFPYVYLGLAYLQTNQYDKAKENFDRARGDKMPASFANLMAGGEKDLGGRVLAAAKTTPAAPSAAAPAPTTSSPAATAPVAAATAPAAATTVPAATFRNANFDKVLTAAEASLSARKYDAALKGFDSLRTLDAAEYTRGKVQARRDEAAGQWGRQVADEGARLVQDGKLTEARTRLQEADKIAPGQRAVQDALADIRNRESSYQTLKAGAAQDASGNNLAAARDKYQQAQKAHPELFAADKLDVQLTAIVNKLGAPATAAAPVVATAPAASTGKIADASLKQFENGRQLSTQGRYREAEAAYSAAVTADKANQQASAALAAIRTYTEHVNQSRAASKRGDVGGAIQRLQDARTLDLARFDREKLGGELEALVAKTAADPEGKALRVALLALLRGDAKASSDVLEPLITKPGNPKSARLVDLQAYLGVAYATRALTATTDEEQQQLRGKAMEYFRLASAAKRDYRLSARLVSPRIVAMFDQAGK